MPLQFLLQHQHCCSHGSRSCPGNHAVEGIPGLRWSRPGPSNPGTSCPPRGEGRPCRHQSHHDANQEPASAFKSTKSAAASHFPRAGIPDGQSMWTLGALISVASCAQRGDSLSRRWIVHSGRLGNGEGAAPRSGVCSCGEVNLQLPAKYRVRQVPREGLWTQYTNRVCKHR